MRVRTNKMMIDFNRTNSEVSEIVSDVLLSAAGKNALTAVRKTTRKREFLLETTIISIAILNEISFLNRISIR